jgi:hypothetical protein
MARRPVLLICLLGALGACSPEAAAYKHPFDRLVVELGLVGWSGYYPCSVVTSEDGYEVISSVASEDCFRFDRPRRMRGVWLLENETSQLLPDAARSPAVWDIMDENQTFLEVKAWTVQEALPPPIEGEEENSPSAYAIEFVGRRALYPGLYGGPGARHMVIMDKLLSARAIYPPRPPDWPAIVGELRRAEAAREASAPHKPILRCPFFLCPRPRPADRIED